MIEILKPIIGLHDGSCFRELLDIWAEHDFCRLIPNVMLLSDPSIEETLRPEARPWMEGMNNILLYDNTILDKLQHVGHYNKALFANEVLHAGNTSPWIFWPRFPREYFKFQETYGYKIYEERKNESIFIGNNTTSKRNGDWSKVISFYFMGSHAQHFKNNMNFNYYQYLTKLQNSKFGLCLPGQGPKSLRENECMGLGVVPIFTPGVSTDYYDKLEKDKHYLYAETPYEVPTMIQKCSKEKWEYMSNECIKWHNKNSSIEGSWKTTLEAIENIK